MGPCTRVRSRGIGKGLDRRLVAEAFQAGSIVVVDELAEEGVAIGVGGGRAGGTAAVFLPARGLGGGPGGGVPPGGWLGGVKGWEEGVGGGRAWEAVQRGGG